MAYDIIGDIHGQADKLESLLAKLGYKQENGVWTHGCRQVIFVGDFIDRGPAQLRTVEIVRRMVESGAALAVMGNHELNAIAWHTPDPEHPGEYLRQRFSMKWGEKNRRQHERFLAETEHLPDIHADIIDWFKTLPLWLDLPEIRVVHACWHQSFMDWLSASWLDGAHRLKTEAWVPATREPADESEKDNACPTVFKAVEALTKGIEIPLPKGHTFHDKDGFERNRVRIRWWDSNADTYQTSAMLSDAIREQLPATALPPYAHVGLATDKPVFFGHYWMSGRPGKLSPHAACVDYSAGKGGPLVAYRWDGEKSLTDCHFISTD